MNQEEMIKKITVILKSVLTWLVAIQTALTWIIASGTLDGTPVVIEWGLVILGIIGVAVTFIRRVTAVDVSERGILPVKGGKYDKTLT